MPTSLCPSCQLSVRIRLRRRIFSLESLRRPYQSSTTIRHLSNNRVPNVSSLYWDTPTPNPAQLSAAESFFRSHPPRKLWTATEWRKHNRDAGESVLTPEVTFLGRSNVGKSSLLNALLLSPKLNHVGPRPGKTTTMHAWALAASNPTTGGAVKGTGGDLSTKLAVLDMPGYGHGSHDDWGQEIITYLRRRKQLRRAFLLLDAEHGIKQSDLKMLDLLNAEGISHQIIASKCDRFPCNEKGQAGLAKSLNSMRTFIEGGGKNARIMALGEIIAVGAVGDGRKNDMVNPAAMRGIAEVQWAILRATGLDEFALTPRGTRPSTTTPGNEALSPSPRATEPFMPANVSPQQQSQVLPSQHPERMSRSSLRAKNTTPASTDPKLERRPQPAAASPLRGISLRMPPSARLAALHPSQARKPPLSSAVLRSSTAPSSAHTSGSDLQELWKSSVAQTRGRNKGSTSTSRESNVSGMLSGLATSRGATQSKPAPPTHPSAANLQTLWRSSVGTSKAKPSRAGEPWKANVGGMAELMAMSSHGASHGGGSGKGKTASTMKTRARAGSSRSRRYPPPRHSAS